MQKWPIIFSRDLMMGGEENKQVIRNQFERWQKKKLLIRLRRGAYLLNPADRKINVSRMYIANQLYNPSYLSLEYALTYYGIIPERVSDLTSVTTKKTMRFDNEAGSFIYQHIKPKAFNGFVSSKDEAGLLFFIAEPEKAVADFLYLNLHKFHTKDEKVFEESYRLQNIEILKTKKLMAFAACFTNKKLTRVSEMLCKLIKKEGGQ